MFVFLTYLPVFLLKFWSGELIGCGIWFRIQRVPTLHTFDGPATPKQEIPEKMWWWHHHHVFSGISCFWGSGVRQKYAVWVLVGFGIKLRMQRALLIEIWVKTQRDMSKIRTKKVFSFMTNMSIQPLWLTHFIEILLVLEFQLTKLIVGPFSYKAHFRPQISSNALESCTFLSPHGGSYPSTIVPPGP